MSNLYNDLYHWDMTQYRDTLCDITYLPLNTKLTVDNNIKSRLLNHIIIFLSLCDDITTAVGNWHCVSCLVIIKVCVYEYCCEMGILKMAVSLYKLCKCILVLSIFSRVRSKIQSTIDSPVSLSRLNKRLCFVYFSNQLLSFSVYEMTISLHTNKNCYCQSRLSHNKKFLFFSSAWCSYISYVLPNQKWRFRCSTMYTGSF